MLSAVAEKYSEPSGNSSGRTWHNRSASPQRHAAAAVNSSSAGGKWRPGNSRGFGPGRPERGSSWPNDRNSWPSSPDAGNTGPAGERATRPRRTSGKRSPGSARKFSSEDPLRPELLPENVSLPETGRRYARIYNPSNNTTRKIREGYGGFEFWGKPRGEDSHRPTDSRQRKLLTP